MTKPTIVSRASLGRPLTYTELDANFTNLRDAVFQVEGLNDDSTGGNFTVEQGGDFTLRGGSNITVTVDSGNRIITVNSLGGDVVNDTTPQLGGDLDVNGKKIVSAANGNIVIDPAGTGDITLQGADANTYILVDGSSNNIIELNSKSGNKQAGLDLTAANGQLTMNYYDSAAHADSGQYFPLNSNGIELTTDSNVTGNILIQHTGTGKIELAGAVKISATAGTPTTYENGYYAGMLVTPASWLKITVGATTYYLPLFT